MTACDGLQRPVRALQQLLGSLNGVVGCFPPINSLALAFHISGNSFLHIYLHLKRPLRRLKLRCRVTSAHVRTSQYLHGGGNCFLDLFWHLNSPASASQHHIGGLNDIEGCFPTINRLTPALQEFHSSEHCFLSVQNCFLHPCWYINRSARASQDHRGG